MKESTDFRLYFFLSIAIAVIGIIFGVYQCRNKDEVKADLTLSLTKKTLEVDYVTHQKDSVEELLNNKKILLEDCLKKRVIDKVNLNSYERKLKFQETECEDRVENQTINNAIDDANDNVSLGKLLTEIGHTSNLSDARRLLLQYGKHTTANKADSARR